MTSMAKTLYGLLCNFMITFIWHAYIGGTYRVFFVFVRELITMHLSALPPKWHCRLPVNSYPCQIVPITYAYPILCFHVIHVKPDSKNKRQADVIVLFPARFRLSLLVWVLLGIRATWTPRSLTNQYFMRYPV